MAPDLPINCEFFFHFLDSQYPDSRRCQVLDCGCGDGAVVCEGTKRGYRMSGVDNFYADADRVRTILFRAQVDGLPMHVIFGRDVNTKPDSEWLDEALDWMDQHVFYRSREEIEQCFSPFFDVESYTRHQLVFHLSNKWGVASRLLLSLLRYAPTALVLERLQWRRRGHTIFCRSRKQE